MDERLTVVMPAYNQSEELVELTTNAVASFGDVDLIVVDNASKFGGGFLRSVATVYLRNRENLGYAKAVNQGLDLAKTPLVAIANTDVRVSPNWQEVTRAIFDRHWKIESLHFRMTDYGVPFRYGTQLALTGKERWCTGSFFVVDNRRGHRFDERFFNSYDDWDFQLEARLAGWQTAYTDRACYQHRHSSSQVYIPDREANNKRNAEYFKEKHGAYAEEILAKDFPEQVAADYWKGFSL